VLWIAIDVALAVIGLLVLALLAVRLYGQVRTFGRQVTTASERLAEVSARIAEIAPAQRPYD
jgi:uncharacterized membrane protein (Fun14 family)